MKTIVLICSHNGERFIQDQIMSILNQSVGIDTIFIHDYNSTDKTRSILSSLKLKYSNKVEIHEFNFAFSTTHSFLNSLSLLSKIIVEEAIIYLCDQDDYWLNDKNEVVCNLFKESDIDFLFHQVLICDESLNPQKPFYNIFWRPERDFKLPNQYVSNCVIGHTIAIKSSSLSSLNLEFNENIPMHDWHIALQILISSKKWHYIDKPLSLYRQHDQNQLGSTNSPLKAAKRMLKVGELIHKFNIELDYTSSQTQPNPSVFKSILHIRPFFKLLYIFVSYYQFLIFKSWVHEK